MVHKYYTIGIPILPVNYGEMYPGILIVSRYHTSCYNIYKLL